MTETVWTQHQVCEHIKLNMENTYSLTVVVAALYHKLYGERPYGIGLSGMQADCVDQVVKQLPPHVVTQRRP